MPEHCEWCRNKLTPEEIAYPARGGTVGAVCDSCYRKEYEYECCWCGYFEDCDQQELIVVTEPVPAQGGTVQPGVYRILQSPCHAGNCLESWLLGSAIRRLCDLPGDLEPDPDYPAGYLCRDCQQRVNDQLHAEWVARTRGPIVF